MIKSKNHYYHFPEPFSTSSLSFGNTWICLYLFIKIISWSTYNLPRLVWSALILAGVSTVSFSSSLSTNTASGLMNSFKPFHHSGGSNESLKIDKNIQYIYIYLSFFMATPAAYRDSQARGPIWAVAANPHHSHGNVRSEPCWDLHHSSRQRWILNPLSEGGNLCPRGYESSSWTTELFLWPRQWHIIF